MLGEDVDEWLIKNVGIRERHVMAESETTSDLVVHAARQALTRAGLQAEKLDMIIVATDTPDYLSPATSSVVQAKLGATNAGTFDVNSACAGWVTALDAAARWIRTDSTVNRVLVAGAYGMTKFVDWKDKYTCTLFADGAAVVILEVCDSPGHLAGTLKAEGSYHDALGIYTGGTSRPATPEAIAGYGRPHVEFVRKFPRTFNSDNWPSLVKETLGKADLRMDDVSLFIFTQLNLRTIELVMHELGQPMTKTHWVMDKWGYLGSACIPAVLDDAMEMQKRPNPGDVVVFCATGGGMALACSLWKWI
jgi:3-oxoacyl-[acyl-carrier-protein] synthase-3